MQKYSAEVHLCSCQLDLDHLVLIEFVLLEKLLFEVDTVLDDEEVVEDQIFDKESTNNHAF
jgi:hypothetical protein